MDHQHNIIFQVVEPLGAIIPLSLETLVAVVIFIPDPTLLDLHIHHRFHQIKVCLEALEMSLFKEQDVVWFQVADM